ncbi:MAG: DNA repair protein RadA [Saccharofermentanales bacterium]
MAKPKVAYFCSECGHETSGWMGKCPGCGSWNTIVEEKIAPAAAVRSVAGGGWLAGIGSPDGAKAVAVGLDAITGDPDERRATGIGELDRVLGGGLVAGSVVLVGGEPGIGKSTLLMQVCGRFAAEGTIAYISGEESPRQIKLRADRLGVTSGQIKLIAGTSFDQIAEYLISAKPAVAIIDSIQTMFSPDISAAPGSVSQVREVTAGLLRIAKTTGTAILLVGHVTKDGSIAGPRVLEHMVDTVLYFEGDRHSQYRIIRAVKNRFGATDEIGVFEMTGQGLSEVPNPSSAMLEGRPRGVPGTVITACMEGTRPVLVEVQALLNEIAYGNPARVTQGLDRTRAGMLLAVAEKKLNIGLGSMDAYINIVGGLNTDEPSTDLAVAAAVVSAARNKPARPGAAIFGEVGLTGEIRPVSSAVRRAAEARRMGFESCILPGACRKQFEKTNDTDLPDLLFVDSLGEMVDILF